MIVLREKCFAQRRKHPRFVRTEVVGEDQIESSPDFRLIFIVPVWAVPTAAALNLFYREPKQEEVFLSCFFSIVAPSRVKAPFIMNFMLLVPLASYPAVEIWLDTSLAGINRSASVTLYSGTKTTLRRLRTAGSRSIVAARLLMNFMISLASR